MPGALRRLFSTILTFCQPSEPVTLWERYFEDLSADYQQKFPNNATKVRHSIVRDVKQAPIPQSCIDSRNVLNRGQQTTFDIIMNRVRNKQPVVFFIDGLGGIGKTFLYNALYAEIRLMGEIVLPTATSGIAASNIPSGRTAHSRFKIPIDLEQSRACDVPKQGSLAALIKKASLIIWDKASMARREIVESLDALLRDLCNKDIIFGGKVIVFGGDFRQILPVVQNRSVGEVVEASLISSPLWPHFIKISLTENFRARADPEFAEYLLALGNGALQDEDQGNVPLPAGVLTEIETETSETLTGIGQKTFPEMFGNNCEPGIFTTRAILTPMNEDVDGINATMIETFPGAAVTYKSFDTMLDDNCNVYPSEFINKLCPGRMTPHDLVLKEKCPVILLRNLLPAFGLCNGTRLTCHKFFPNVIECIIATGHNKGEHVFIPRITLRSPTTYSYPFQFQRKKFPIKLSFAMTINKSQGQTLERVSIYLPRPCFAPGQLYVALSRAKQAAKVSVLSITARAASTTHLVRNIVSFEALRLAGIVQ